MSRQCGHAGERSARGAIAGGADFAVDYTKDGWRKEVLRITGGRGVGLVYDPVERIRGTPCSAKNGFHLYRFAECIAWSGWGILLFSGPANAVLLPLEDGCEEGGWDWEPRILTRPLRCASLFAIDN